MNWRRFWRAFQRGYIAGLAQVAALATIALILVATYYIAKWLLG